MKFGGTSVGSPQRMHSLIGLIDNAEAKIVVLSAMSGTTNSLVEISQALYQKENDKAAILIDLLEKNYSNVIQELYTTESSVSKAKELLSIHFDYVRSFEIFF